MSSHDPVPPYSPDFFRRCLEFFLIHPPETHGPLFLHDATDNDVPIQTNVEQKEPTDFKKYSQSYLSLWIDELSSQMELGEDVRLSEDHLWHAYLGFYGDICTLRKAANTGDLRLRDTTLRQMLCRWFGVKVRKLDCLNDFRNSVVCCCTIDPWFRADSSPTCIAEHLWTENQVYCLTDLAAKTSLALQLSKRRRNVLSFTIAAAVLGIAEEDDRLAEYRVSERSMAEALYDVAEELLQLSPHDQALGSIDGVCQLKASNVILHSTCLSDVLPFGKLLVVHPEEARLDCSCKIILQGALEDLRPLCDSIYHDDGITDLNDEWNNYIDTAVVEFERNGLITVAYAELPYLTTASLSGIEQWDDPVHVWQQLKELPPFTFIGLAGYSHKLCAPVAALRRWGCKGIQLLLASEFSWRETQHYARQLGILEEGGLVVDGHEADSFTVEDWDILLKQSAPVVLARATTPRREALLHQLEAYQTPVMISRGFSKVQFQGAFVLFAGSEIGPELPDLKVDNAELATLVNAWRALQVYEKF